MDIHIIIIFKVNGQYKAIYDSKDLENVKHILEIPIHKSADKTEKSDRNNHFENN